MKQTKRRFLRVFGTIIGGVSLAGCAGDDDDSDTDDVENEDTPTPEQEDEDTPTPEQEDEDTPTPEQEDEDTPTPEPDPAFSIVQVAADEIAAISDGVVSVELIVENSGGDGTAQVELSMGPLTTVEESEEISEGESLPVTFDLEIEALDPGRYELTATVDDDTDSVLIDAFEDMDEPGIYGSVISEAEESLSGSNVQMFGFEDGESGVEKTGVDGEGQFYLPHPLEPEYNLSSAIYTERGVFNGVPPVYDSGEQQTVASDVVVLGRVEIPEAYQTQVQLVDTDGEPLTDFTPVGIRTQGGSGDGKFTTDSDGFMIAEDADEPGIAVPPSGEGEFDIEAQIADAEGYEVEVFGTIHGSPEGEEFTFEVEDPNRFE